MYLNSLVVNGNKCSFWEFMNSECSLYGRLMLGRYSCEIKNIGMTHVSVKFISPESVESMIQSLSVDWAGLEFELVSIEVGQTLGRLVHLNMGKLTHNVVSEDKLCEIFPVLEINNQISENKI